MGGEHNWAGRIGLDGWVDERISNGLGFGEGFRFSLSCRYSLFWGFCFIVFMIYPSSLFFFVSSGSFFWAFACASYWVGFLWSYVLLPTHGQLGSSVWSGQPDSTPVLVWSGLVSLRSGQVRSVQPDNSILAWLGGGG